MCCIDEFDKMSAEHQSLLEAMEQQCVSVAKAGLVASLSAQTTVLAVANPVGGHYNRAKTVNEKLQLVGIVSGSGVDECGLKLTVVEKLQNCHLWQLYSNRRDPPKHHHWHRFTCYL